MSDHSTLATAPADATGLTGFVHKHYFLLRRLHSLSGIIPVGVFVIEHLFTNSAILLGPEEFQRDIDFIYMLPGLLAMEIFGIWLPIAFHAALGIVYTFTGRPNVAHYPYQDNWRYTAQRTTGIIALIYIFLHIATTRWQWNIFGWYTPFDPDRATVTTAEALQFAWWVPWFYLIGTLSIVFHFANGLWTAAISWGLTVTPASQRRWGWVCAFVGVLLAFMGTAAIYAFSTLDIEKVEAESHTTQVHQELAPAGATETAPPAIEVD